MSVALTIDVSRNDANPKMKLSAKQSPAGNTITTRRHVIRPPIRYANTTATAVPMMTRQNTMVDDDSVDALDEQRTEAPREHRQRDGQQRQPTPLMLHGHGRTLPESLT